MVTQAAVERGYQKMIRMPQEKVSLVLALIDQLSAGPVEPVLKQSHIKIGIADGEYHIPDDINQYDDDIAEMFGVVT